MKRHLNTLYVTTQGAYLSKDGESVAVQVERETKMRLPLHTLGGIVCFGGVGASPALLGHCAELGVGLSFLTEHGRFLARVQGPISGNVLLRREQYRRSDDEPAAAALVRSMLTGKILNSRAVLLRALRDRPGTPGA
jgi:CRISPR-associated protein Cas1